jgi:hypothetical protein
MDDNYSKCEKRGETMSKDDGFCDIINLGSWLWDLIAEIMDCKCKK